MHPGGACGTASVPPTLNYEEPDPECPVRVAGKARSVEKRFVVKTAFTEMGQCARGRDSQVGMSEALLGQLRTGEVGEPTRASDLCDDVS